MIELIFDRCENSKKVTCNIPRFLSRKKDSWVVLLGQLDRKFWNDVFFGYPIKNVAITVQGLRVFHLASEKFHVDSATRAHPISKRSFFGFTFGFSGTKTGQAGKNHSECHKTSTKLHKTSFWNFRSSHFELRKPKVPLQAWNLGRTHLEAFLNWATAKSWFNHHNLGKKYKKGPFLCRVWGMSILGKRHHAFKNTPGCPLQNRTNVCYNHVFLFGGGSFLWNWQPSWCFFVCGDGDMVWEDIALRGSKISRLRGNGIFHPV